MEKKNMIAHLVSTRRVARVGKGGKTFRISALVVVGDEKGSVGYGLGKSFEVPESIRKARRFAEKRMMRVKLYQNRTLHCDVKAKYCSSTVYIRKAKPGTGIVAGGAARFVFEALGVKDVVCKVLGSNPINNIKAVLKALNRLNTPSEIARMRGVEVDRLFYRREAQ